MARTTRPVASTRRPKGPTAPMSPRRAQFIAAGVALAFIALIVVIVIANSTRTTPEALPTVSPTDAGELVRADSHLLTAATPETADVVLVEFLDFQCPGCAAASTIVEQLAADYGDRLSIAVRNLPLTSIHPHAVDAALAAEAAGAQDQYPAMYAALFATQAEWSSAAGDQGDTFRALADELGLDLAEYDRVVGDPATRERIALDLADALALGANSTPTFFLDGELVQLTSLDELRQRVEAALNE